MTILIRHLQRSFAERSKKNASYSLRAFARSIGVDASTLSALLKGNRPMSAKMAMKILNRLEIEDPLLKAAAIEQVLGSATKDRGNNDFVELKNVQFEPISSWEHFAILSLLEIPDAHWSDKKIAQRLNISIGIVLEALSRLSAAGLIVRKKNSWVLLSKNITTSNDVPNANVRRANREYIERAMMALENEPINRRSITGMTMAIDEKKLPVAKEMIKDFRRKLANFLENGEKNQVFRLNVQLFPLTNEWRK